MVAHRAAPGQDLVGLGRRGGERVPAAVEQGDVDRRGALAALVPLELLALVGNAVEHGHLPHEARRDEVRRERRIARVAG